MSCSQINALSSKDFLPSNRRRRRLGRQRDEAGNGTFRPWPILAGGAPRKVCGKVSNIEGTVNAQSKLCSSQLCSELHRLQRGTSAGVKTMHSINYFTFLQVLSGVSSRLTHTHTHTHTKNKHTQMAT
ncbi:hypothetical protein THAOC_20462 [Thalassiosira oceanica]|uniref:Uncharacterized protein n=1 Tax=Thalassiosira oceanica TaxID=159749 RepID=K0S276_THAOC|nr:hypothetical protein THAOC_20462 [Thalassiosira oceanica]|eukprot:EJK59330.1 hypothetical protein THAOC_20462 [Thalassiosira oceanica]